MYYNTELQYILFYKVLKNRHPKQMLLSLGGTKTSSIKCRFLVGQCVKMSMQNETTKIIQLKLSVHLHCSGYLWIMLCEQQASVKCLRKLFAKVINNVTTVVQIKSYISSSLPD